MQWDFLSLQARAVYTYTTDLRLDVSNIMMRYASVIEAETMELEVHDFHLEGAATLDVAARGPVATTGNITLHCYNYYSSERISYLNCDV